jgi:hypothetical protein
MRTYYDVLIVDAYMSADFSLQLLALRLVPIPCNNQETALELLKHRNFAAAFVVGGQDDIDPLEFVLNAEEVKPDMPVFVIDHRLSEEDARVLRTWDNVMVLTEDINESNRLIRETIRS